LARSRFLLSALCFSAASFAASASAQQAPSEDPPRLAGSEVPAPKRTKTVSPEYPPEAQAQGLRGIVILELVIDTDGKVGSVEVVRSVAPFDDAAVSAVRQWEYEVTKLDGKPVRVRMTVPISFALRLPDVKRQDGIPELRQGAAPAYPHGKQGGGTVVAQVTLDADGRVGEAEVRSGETPWSDALLQALRTWRFNVPSGRGTLSFRVEAEFMPGGGSVPPRVNLELKGLQESESVAADASRPAAAPAEPSPVASPAASERADGPPAMPAPQPMPPAASPEPAASAPEPQVQPTPPPAAPAPARPATPAGEPPRPSRTAPPPVETISAPPPVETLPAPPPASLPPGVSALPNVMLGAGVPDLVRGRRPVPPPVARMAGVTGTVEVHFSVDGGGQSSVKSGDGPDLLKPAAEEAVRTWAFRRATTERLHLVAAFSYSDDAATVLVNLEP
jgi:TonB family protein